MNLADKIRAEREVLASQKAIKKAENTAKALEVNEQLTAIDNVAFAEWFLTEVDIGGKWSSHFPYDLMVKNGKAEFQIDKLYVTEDNQTKTKIASLIYASHHKDGFIGKDKSYADDEFRYCFGDKAVEKIMNGLEDMGIGISVIKRKGAACNMPSYEVTSISA